MLIYSVSIIQFKAFAYMYYKNILEVLADGSCTQEEITRKLAIGKQGRISEYLWELELAGFVTKDHAWSFKTGQDTIRTPHKSL